MYKIVTIDTAYGYIVDSNGDYLREFTPEELNEFKTKSTGGLIEAMKESV